MVTAISASQRCSIEHYLRAYEVAELARQTLLQNMALELGVSDDKMGALLSECDSIEQLLDSLGTEVYDDPHYAPALFSDDSLADEFSFQLRAIDYFYLVIAVSALAGTIYLQIR